MVTRPQSSEQGDTRFPRDHIRVSPAVPLDFQHKDNQSEVEVPPCPLQQIMPAVRMLMEAVIESLKDLELPHPNAGEQLASVSPASAKSSQKDDQEMHIQL
ncbi:hypothetical protein OIU77_011288 [Salix suchowensis]|uniref:Uncharacterized protein n=1 Tax=Salix suchowensis TaxID=1278906 RepID=A0ABQ8ZZM7_9ROSI|nr:hypothetical protein OIU77_011288 [Salix suchowensis]